jgi:prophage maintenance system killer protein
LHGIVSTSVLNRSLRFGRIFTVARCGGSPGVRDLGLLECALFRPPTGYYTNVAEMAAGLFESLIMNRPFFDGNKRVAFFATDVFLRMSGYAPKVAEKKHPDCLLGCWKTIAAISIGRFGGCKRAR